MRVLYITNNAKMYGANLCLFEMVTDLKARYGVEPIILVKEKGDLTEKLEREGITCICIPFANALLNREVGYVKNLYWYVRDVLCPAYKIGKKLKKEEHIDIIHSGTSVIDIGFFLSQKLNTPHIWHIRETDEQYDFKFLLPNTILRIMYRKAAAVVAISKFVSDKFQQKVGNIERAKVVYDGIYADQYFSYNVKKFHVGNRVKFCIVGLVYKNKNQYKVLQACNELSRRGIDNYELYIVGDGEKEEIEKLKSYVDLNNMQDNVFFLGYRTDIDEILRTMDVGIMASKMEGFGRVTIEYMTHYMPVIASESGANIELVKGMETGLIYGIDDEIEMANHMQYFIDNLSEIERMGKNAYDFACEKFTVIKNTDEMFKLYQEVIEEDIL